MFKNNALSIYSDKCMFQLVLSLCFTTLLLYKNKTLAFNYTYNTTMS